MKQTLRERAIPDKVFLRQWAEQNGVQLDPPPEPSAQNLASATWLHRALRWIDARIRAKR